jgi:hypothetical protein
VSASRKLNETLRALGRLIEEEADRNPSFAEKLEAITAGLPVRSAAQRKDKAQHAVAEIPDVLKEYETRGSDEFRFWLRVNPVPQLRAIIKANGFDPEKKSARWTEPDKLIGLIAEQTAARLKRGSAFLE